MTGIRTAPYGSWESPISSELVAACGSGWGWLLREIQVHGRSVYWIEPKPEDGGRNTIVCRREDGSIAEVIPEGYSARTRVHEYGGGDYCVLAGTVFFSNEADQRLYRLAAGGTPIPITPEPPTGESWRFADGSPAADGQFILCVRECHDSNGKVQNEIVAVQSDGAGEVKTVVRGSDFYASPRISPDGRRIAWLSWDLPRMPWDGTELWAAKYHPDGSISPADKIAGSAAEWISNPSWSPDGNLYFLSDRSNWSNLYRWNGSLVDRIFDIEADLDRPAWSFGYTRYAFLSQGRIACVFWKDGLEHLGLYEPQSRSFRKLDTPFTAIPYLASDGEENLWFLGGNFEMRPAVVRINLEDGSSNVVYRGASFEIEAGYLSRPRPIDYPTFDGEVAHALYYPPSNPDYDSPADELAPLIVRCHGGPTSAAHPFLQPEFLFFTSRGFGVLDVNYRGSSGYGRSYREALRGQWGHVDTEDCLAAARCLIDRGETDPGRQIMRGSSAGGWTTLCALTFHNLFRAGAVYYAVADAERLVNASPKFESCYVQYLIGPYPAERQLYLDRSPIHHTQELSSPLIVFQGMRDKIVPPSQSETLIEALREKKLPYAYLTFPNEGHGFRRAESLKRSLEAELSFYAQIFGFVLADSLEAVTISNLAR
jgi:dipeptidyl aminopeptidase/acylaminoacyl peptidase